MKNKLLFLLAGVCLLFAPKAQAQRYLNDVFTNINVQPNVLYGVNITVITGSPAADSLKMDVYTPAGDTSTRRPLLIYLHTGSFLPPIVNGSPTGSRKDSATVRACKRLAARGYVVAAASYRLGWNPQGDQATRTGTILNAVYRGTIDAKTAIRYFRRTFEQMGNPYGIDTSRIVLVGQGTGGYLALTAATLNKPSELTLPKFINPTTSTSYVNQALSGNFDGTDSTALNVPNHKTFSSRFHMAVNLAGALGDSSWLEAGEVPILGMHSVTDPFAPYTTGVVLVPGTTFQVVEVSGSADVVRRANYLGNNAAIANVQFTDPVSVKAASLSPYAGLYPMYIAPTNRPQAGPWDFWDSTIVKNINIGPYSGATAHSNSMLTNPNMSSQKSFDYIDTVVNFICPRMVQVLNLPGAIPTSVVEIMKNTARIAVYPNPSVSDVTVQTSDDDKIESIEVSDLSGRIVSSIRNINDTRYTLNRDAMVNGIYVVRAKTSKGIAIQKLILE